MDETNEAINEPEHDQPASREMTELRSAVLRECAPKPDMEAEWERIARVIENDCETDRKLQPKRTHRRILWTVTAAAAAVVLAFLLTHRWNSPDGVRVFTADKATQEVMLAAGDSRPQPLRAADMTFREPLTTSPARLLTLSTPRGKDFQVTLPDGSKVWLNADSKLTFPERFDHGKRIVRLQGEAYFEVAKDGGRRFEVETDYFTTIVHGTTFNLRAYSARNASVVLIEGSVSVSRNGRQCTLKPGEMASLKSDRSFAVKEVDTYSYQQWHQGFFYFDNQTLFEIMQDLGRWYNVSIVFEDTRKMGIRLHFVANRRNSLAEAIRNMNDMGVVHIEQENDAIVIR